MEGDNCERQRLTTADNLSTREIKHAAHHAGRMDVQGRGE